MLALVVGVACEMTWQCLAGTLKDVIVVQMMTSAIYGHKLTPAVLADEKGNVVVVQHCASPHWLERLLRPVSASLSLSANVTTYVQSASEQRTENAKSGAPCDVLPRARV